MKFVKKLAKYAPQQLVGVLLFLVAHRYATVERGYEALGGEIFFLFLPLIIRLVGSCVKDIRAVWKSLVSERSV